MSENPKDLELFHYGVKGMKWGVRRSDKELATSRRSRYNDIRNRSLRSIEVTAKNGKKVTATEEPYGRVASFIASLSKNGVERANSSGYFKIESEGRHVGEAGFRKKSSDELYLSWIGIKQSERGQGYGSAIFDAAINHGKSEGVSKLTLEVPGNAPDARHIYEKKGFKVTKEPTAKEIRKDPVWGGLTYMELDLTKESIRHANLSEDEELELAIEQTFPQLTESQEELVFGNSDDIEHASDLELFHYGVKGMKWGVRKDRSKRKGIRQRIKERDEKIETARDNQLDTWKKEARALNKSVRSKGSLVKDFRNPEKRSEAKTATAARKKATAERVENDRIANKKTSREIAIKGATYALPVVLSAAYVGAGAAGTRRNAKIGEKLKNDIFADTKGLPAPGVIALQFVDGKWQ